MTARGCFSKGTKLIVPKALQSGILETVHETHLGAEKCKDRARAVLYWPTMTQQIDAMVSDCPVCLRFRKSMLKEPMISHPIPAHPWLKVAADIMSWRGADYLIVVDYFSKYIEFTRLQDKTAASVISNFQAIFARHGIPQELVSDNMPFNSREFRRFANEWDLTLTTSSSTYPQSNGLAERGVQTIKNLLKKAAYEGKDPHLALLNLRSSPISGLKYSPAELLFGRQLRTKLPAKLQVVGPDARRQASEQLIAQQSRQKFYYDRGARPHPALSPGDVVRVQTKGEWEPAVVTATHPTPRSYTIIRQGKAIRRNTRHLMPTNEEAPPADTMADQDQETLDEDPETLPETEIIEQEKGGAWSGGQRSTGSSLEKEHRQLYHTASGRVVRRPARYRDYA